MWKDKSLGVKILWVWTIATAAVLVANVATTRLRDFDNMMKAPESQTHPPPQATDSPVMVDNSTDTTEEIREEKI